MIRHGQASFGKPNYDKLSEIGILQSQILAEHLVSKKTIFDVIYTGTMIRHIETESEYLKFCDKLNISYPPAIRLEALNEYKFENVMSELIPFLLQKNPGLSDKINIMFSNKRAFQEIFNDVMMTWVSGEFEHLTELMTWSEYKRIVNEGISSVLTQHGKGKTIGIFSSGGPIAVAVQTALNLTDEMAMSVTWQIVNSSVSRFKCTTEKFMLSTFNEFSHFENDEAKGLITYR